EGGSVRDLFSECEIQRRIARAGGRGRQGERAEILPTGQKRDDDHRPETGRSKHLPALRGIPEIRIGKLGEKERLARLEHLRLRRLRARTGRKQPDALGEIAQLRIGEDDLEATDLTVLADLIEEADVAENRDRKAHYRCNRDPVVERGGEDGARLREKALHPLDLLALGNVMEGRDAGDDPPVRRLDGSRGDEHGAARSVAAEIFDFLLRLDGRLPIESDGELVDNGVDENEIELVQAGRRFELKSAKDRAMADDERKQDEARRVLRLDPHVVAERTGKRSSRDSVQVNAG